MKCRLFCATLVPVLLVSLGASARDVVLPAGTLLQCTLNEPNFSSASVDVGDPVLCHLRGITEFGQQAFPRGSYLVGHLEAAKDPGHFVGKGYLKLQFDRIGLPSGDLPLEAKVIATRGYRVDREGKIVGHGHPRRDVIEWMLPPLWPWKVIMLPARGPRAKLKGETVLSLRLMDDVQVPQVAKTYGPNWRFFGKPQNESYRESQYQDGRPTLAIRNGTDSGGAGSVIGEARASFASLVSRVVNPGAPVATPGPVFVLKTGAVLAVGDYHYQDGRITYTLANGGGGVVSSDEVDWSTTTKVNSERGVRMTLHSGHSIPEIPGL